MAQQLQAQGQHVGFLGLIDTYFPGKPEYLPARSRFRALVYPPLGRLERELAEYRRLGLPRYWRGRHGM